MMYAHAQRRKGNVVVITAVCLVSLLSIVALALDGGVLLDQRRQVQATADAAALAAASELFASTFTNGGLDNGPIIPNPSAPPGPPAGSIAQYAKQIAKNNGFEDGVNDVTVTVNIPPQSGPFTGVSGHVEVIITASQQRYFSTIFGSRENVPYGARAVARGTRTTFNNGIIVLNPTQDASMTAGGGGTITVKGSASVIVDSMAPGAMNANGGTTVIAPKFDVTGSWVTSGGSSFQGTINTGVPPTPDPLRFIPAPDPSTLFVQSDKKIQYSGSTPLILQPGVYIGGVSVTGQGSVFMNPGIYYMQGGGFNIGGQGSLTGYQVMIYNDPQSNSDTISLSGTGAVTLTPPTSGAYKGIVLFQSRTSNYQPTVSVSGAGVAPMQISGTFYASAAQLKVTGNGTQDTIGSQYISDTLTLGGNGTFNVNWDPNVVPGIRQIWLVE